MSTVFISSVIKGFEAYRQTARESADPMDHKPVMSESFGARPYSSETACIHEIEQSDVYLLILGPNYGFEPDEVLSVTHVEFRAASHPVLAFVQECNMKAKQAASRGSVNAYTNKEKTVRQWCVDHDLIGWIEKQKLPLRTEA